MERSIQVAVAWADMIVCTILPWLRVIGFVCIAVLISWAAIKIPALITKRRKRK